ncbi:hypothetical protein FACS1894195_3380 [Bacteroidia bacterium]|nr:hypothetical protein FACS1894195_3380 [Bacteroidia bacterium]
MPIVALFLYIMGTNLDENFDIPSRQMKINDFFFTEDKGCTQREISSEVLYRDTACRAAPAGEINISTLFIVI